MINFVKKNIMKKILYTISLIILSIVVANAQDKKPVLLAGLNGGIVVGDFEDAYSSNIGLDLTYLYPISEKFYLGATTGFANYFGESFSIDGLGNIDIDDAQFIPLTASIRVSPFKNFYGGADVGYAVGLNDGNDGGFTAAPRLTYIINEKFPVYLGYRFISLDEDLGAIQFGVGYILN